MIDKEKRFFGGWWMWILLLIAISIPVFWMLGGAGLLGRTILERKIFEQSYQKQAGDSAKAKIFRAQLAEIDRKLQSTNLSEDQRQALEAKAAAIRIQLNSI